MAAGDSRARRSSHAHADRRLQPMTPAAAATLAPDDFRAGIGMVWLDLVISIRHEIPSRPSSAASKAVRAVSVYRPPAMANIDGGIRHAAGTRFGRVLPSMRVTFTVTDDSTPDSPMPHSYLGCAMQAARRSHC